MAVVADVDVPDYDGFVCLYITPPHSWLCFSIQLQECWLTLDRHQL